MIQMYLARHGQTEENVNRIFQGQLPGRLTEEGKRQAVAMGEELAGVSLDAVVSSDLQRVVDTVQLAVGNRNLPWEKNSLLREIDWGSWTGRPLDSVLMLRPRRCCTNVPDVLWNICVRITKEKRCSWWHMDW